MHRVPLFIVLAAIVGTAQAQFICTLPNGKVITMRTSGCPRDAIQVQSLDGTVLGERKPTKPEPITRLGAPIERRGNEARQAVARADLGSDWPLTVNGGVLVCEPVGQAQAITIEHAGKRYAINGIASGHAQRRGWVAVQPIWADNLAIAGTKLPITR